MFPYHFHHDVSYPYGIDAYPYLPYHEEDHVYGQHDERIFGGLNQLLPPPFGAGPAGGPPLGPPPGQPGLSPSGAQPSVPPPSSPPPSFVPAQSQQAQAFAVDPGGIRRCMFRFTYVWLRGFQEFWFYPIFVGRTSVAGYRWNGFRWQYFGISLRQIQSFTCV